MDQIKETKPVVTMDVSDLTFSARPEYKEWNPAAVSEEVFEKIQSVIKEQAEIPQDYMITGEVTKIEREESYTGYKSPNLVEWKVTIDLGKFGQIYYVVFERSALPEIGKIVTVELPSYLRR